MSSLSHTESTPRLSHARAYLAGTGVTGALIAGALVVFLSLAAFVAFKGLPFGGSGAETGSANLAASRHGAPEAAAAALAAAPRAVPGAPIGAGGATAGARGRNAGGGAANGTNGPTDPTAPVSPGDPVPPAPTAGDPDANRGITGTVQNLDNALGTDLSSHTD